MSRKTSSTAVRQRQAATASTSASVASKATVPVSLRAPARVKGANIEVDMPRLAQSGSFIRIFRADPMSRVYVIKKGLPAGFVDEIAAQMRMPKERLLPALGLSAATVNRKKNDAKPLSREESERVLGMARLVGQVECMVKESGDPTGFNAAEWVARWLEEPLPALGGRRPADFMDTAEGQGIVSNLLARAASGAYA